MAWMTKFIFVLIIFFLFIWRIRKGFYNGIMKEIVTILSGVVSLISVALVFIAVRSYIANARTLLVLCVIGLIIIGIVFKLCNLIFRPILALSNISVIGGFNKILGAVMGAVEAIALSYSFYIIFGYVLDYIGRGAL